MQRLSREGEIEAVILRCLHDRQIDALPQGHVFGEIRIFHIIGKPDIER